MKKVFGYDDYSVSKDGRVYSHKSNRYLSPKIDKYGYKVVSLSKKGKPKHFTIHRLVAITFIPNPNNYPCVNHINENKTDNRVGNLEWCTVKQNDNHGTRNIRIAKSKSKNPVMRKLPNGNSIIYQGVKDAFRKTGIAHSQISKFCRDENNKEWRFLNEKY